LADLRFSDLIISFLTAALNPQTSSHWEPHVCFLGRTCYLVILLGSRRMRITSTANWPSLSGRPQDMWTDLIKFHVVHGFLADIDLSSHGSLCPLLGRTHYWAINITLFASTVHRPPLLGRLQKTDLIFFFLSASWQAVRLRIHPQTSEVRVRFLGEPRVSLPRQMIGLPF
jgi:hypothetical protein